MKALTIAHEIVTSVDRLGFVGPRTNV